MGTQEQHLGQARHTEDFLDSFDIDSTPYLDWAVTGIFYAALHYIRALAARFLFTNISSYADMDRVFSWLEVFRRNSSIYDDYRQLKDDSRAARYDMVRLAPREVKEVRDQEFRRIREFVLASLS